MWTLRASFRCAGLTQETNRPTQARRRVFVQRAAARGDARRRQLRMFLGQCRLAARQHQPAVDDLPFNLVTDFGLGRTDNQVLR